MYIPRYIPIIRCYYIHEIVKNIRKPWAIMRYICFNGPSRRIVVPLFYSSYIKRGSSDIRRWVIHSVINEGSVISDPFCVLNFTFIYYDLHDADVLK